MTPASFTACRAAYRLLLQKSKTEEGKKDYPGYERVLTDLQGRLSNYSSKWREINFSLSQDERKSVNGMRALFLAKARSKGLSDISNYVYKQ